MNNFAFTNVFTLEGEHTQPLTVRAKALVFHDPASQSLLKLIERLAPSDAPILIRGETGTGKELVAQHIHRLSGRKGPFLAVNCGAINEQLAESELFGHEAGAFTGAIKQRKGWFEAAHGGTLFLDEIGDLSLCLQVKLLRVLQEKEVTKLGARQAIPVDIRLVTATNIDLEQAVQAEQFRQDLLFRINIAQLELKPLRERKGDILPLFEYFVQHYLTKVRRSDNLQISASAIQQLLTYLWPGNIRELENIAHYAVLVTEGTLIQAEHLKFNQIFKNMEYRSAQPVTNTDDEINTALSPYQIIESQLKKIYASSQSSSGDLWNTLESMIIATAYSSSFSNQAKTSELLGISRNVVRTLLKRHHLLPPSIKEIAE
ncbi:sigma-54-dependent Fis family transcriptional regulator [Acinetobacter sp. ANC 4633]|uniref:sigma-54 interaction domain-containing protein n=1 Tax=Acinetobacter sp. ANC 4633 TaxID=2529845 RepID=UPI00103E5F3E|nr:sigma-54 dependent transcriptional regulator [Acinetobacter sp. ANC 4633]TCB27878.1 sigma-54-dependent Fis family transcriptional regulator [Acinetobacter sp. ANC 4633]